MAESDAQLIDEANGFIEANRYLEAAKLLNRVENSSLLTPKLRQAVQMAEDMESLLKDEMNGSFKDEGWKKQRENHSLYDFVVYYQVDTNNQLTLRIDLVLESSMLVPLISVLNETDLFAEWMPSWNMPRLGLLESKNLHHLGRGNQIVLVKVAIPQPFSLREVMQHAIAIDAIEEYSSILIHVKDLPPGRLYDGIDIPEPSKGSVRVDFDARFVIRHCPEDHDLLRKSNRVYPDGESKLIITIQQTVDAHVSMVPLSLINFTTRHVISQMIINLADVAADVKSGQRKKHVDAIANNRQLYDWVEERVKLMLSKCQVAQE